jgi:hypothetical protein
MSSEMYVEIVISFNTCLAQIEEAMRPYLCVVIGVHIAVFIVCMNVIQINYKCCDAISCIYTLFWLQMYYSDTFRSLIIIS